MAREYRYISIHLMLLLIEGETLARHEHIYFNTSYVVINLGVSVYDLALT